MPKRMIIALAVGVAFVFVVAWYASRSPTGPQGWPAGPAPSGASRPQ
jgi:hypothetical protein